MDTFTKCFIVVASACVMWSYFKIGEFSRRLNKKEKEIKNEQ